jgi:ATP-dependent Clp protease ATP-binding subunit ClpC
MPIYRYPILIWQDFSGQFTAALVEESPAAVGATRREAVDDLRDFLNWRIGEEEDYPLPDFRDPQLASFKVPVRPEYRENDRIFPSLDAISVTVHCVHGRQKGGLLVAGLPLLGIHFYYSEADSLRELATRYVQQKLHGSTPREISRFLPPPAVWLDQVVVRMPRARRRINDATLPALTAVAEPIGRQSLRRQVGRAWERETELVELASRLGLSTGNVLLVGEAGIGKTTLLAAAIALAEKQRRRKRAADAEDKPQNGPRFWMTSGGRLIAGMRYLGEWEQRCEAVIGELGSISGVLCVENLLDLVRVGDQDPIASVAAFLQTYLRHGELRMVAEATPAELDACRRLLPGLADLFQIVVLEDFRPDAALRVLRHAADHLSRQHGVSFDTGTIELIDRLFRRFRPYQSFPSQVVAFLALLAEQTARGSASRVEGQAQAATVRVSDVLTLFIRQTGLPEVFLRDEIPVVRDDVHSHFAGQIIGQPAACRAAANLAVLFKAGMNDPARPVAVMLFCGPTGVGKTELARALARYFFGRGEQTDRLIRLDMSEYGSYGAALRLLTTPEGEASELIRKVRAQPFSVVLFDEIEKAAPEVFDVLLGLFDEGRLTDRFGRTTSFRSAIIIMTSNLGSEQQGSIGFGHRHAGMFETAVQNFFRPEFFNRIDSVVQFDPLDRETILAVTRKELSELSRREGLAGNQIRLTWSESLVAHFTEKGFDLRYGARPLQRTLEQRVIAPLARYLLAHPVAAGQVIHATVDEFGNACFSVRAQTS